ncbi:GNAT family N-acetyltransferase [Brevundimonas sp. VNH65]|uniref:GNAT family N-acetyltransferase n=1 Tax=Brevundimonas sp. VNH65 TaxID=3400917 RepID=UPI003C0FD875
MIEVRKDDLSGEPVRNLLAYHRATMVADSPPCHAYALDLAGLEAPDITVFSAWREGDLCGVGALRRLDGGVCEIKSMRTHPDHLRAGVGAAVLAALLAEARASGARRVSLETGSGPAFEAALGLYRRTGFAAGPAFGDYVASDFNQFLHLDL